MLKKIFHELIKVLKGYFKKKEQKIDTVRTKHVYLFNKASNNCSRVTLKHNRAQNLWRNIFTITEMISLYRATVNDDRLICLLQMIQGELHNWYLASI